VNFVSRSQIRNFRPSAWSSRFIGRIPPRVGTWTRFTNRRAQTPEPVAAVAPGEADAHGSSHDVSAS
jgi:hypothetical protein